MSIRSKFFWATERDVKRVFRGWELPEELLPDPRPRQAIDFRTGSLYEIRSRIPASDKSAAHNAEARPDIDALPGKDFYGIGWPEIRDLTRSLTALPEAEAREEVLGRSLFAPEGAWWSVFQVPPLLVEALDVTDDDIDFEVFARKWLEIASANESEHTPLEYMTEFVRALRDLIKVRSADQRLFFAVGQ